MTDPEFGEVFTTYLGRESPGVRPYAKRAAAAKNRQKKHVEGQNEIFETAAETPNPISFLKVELMTFSKH